MSAKNRIRLFSFETLKVGNVYTPTDAQIHYLKNVMRLNINDNVFLFDGQSGEYKSRVCDESKKTLKLQIEEKVLSFEKVPDIWLLFAPLKKENTDIVVQKATELGVSKIWPVQTQFSMRYALKEERIKTQMIEAAEQSRRTDLPELLPITDFDKLVQNWPENRKLIYLNETGEGTSFFESFKSLNAPAALFVGPEGGFSKKELEILKNLPYTCSITLGKRILRAETAVIAALSCWQAFCGDWSR